MVSLLSSLFLGWLLGMRHALEPDHLAALTVLMARRGGRRGPALLGAVWGLGHTVALLVVGCVLAVVDQKLPFRLAQAFELLVGLMLLILGGRAVVRTAFSRGGTPDRPAGGPWFRQPLIVGVIHGLAGSGALTALVLARLPTVAARICYIALFGLGSVAGMACLTGLAGWPLARFDGEGRLARHLSVVTGAGSLLLGTFWGWSALRGLLQGD